MNQLQIGKAVHRALLEGVPSNDPTVNKILLKFDTLMKTKNKTVKTYSVNIDMKYSEDIRVKATSLTEAKKKAFKNFKSRLPRKSFSLDGYSLD